MRLLRIERQDLKGDVHIRNDDGRHELRLQFFEDVPAVIAVGRPVQAVRPDGDDRVDETVDLLDHLEQPFGVRLGEVALVGGRLHLLTGQEREDLPVAADRVAIDGQGAAAVLVDQFGETDDLGRWLLVFRVHGEPETRHELFFSRAARAGPTDPSTPYREGRPAGK